MSKNKTHIIKKLILDVNISRQDNHWQLQQRISELCHAQLAPLLDKIFSEMKAHEDDSYIDTMSLNLGDVPLKELEQQISNLLQSELSKELKKHISEQNTQDVSVHPNKSQHKEDKAAGSLPDMLLYFLQFGVLPWHVPKTPPPDIGQLIEEKLTEEPNVLIAFIKNHLNYPNVLKRLSKHISDKSLNMLVEKAGNDKELIASIDPYLDEQKKKQIENVIGNKMKRPDSITAMFYYMEHGVFPKHFEAKDADIPKLIADSLSTDKHTPTWKKFLEQKGTNTSVLERLTMHLNIEQLSVLVKIMDPTKAETALSGQGTLTEQFDNDKLKATLVSAFSKKKEKKETIPDKDPEEEIYVDNAGLVLLWPFFDKFFKTLGYLDQEDWKNNEAKQKAVAMLQYLATGQESFEEYQVPLNKILCGMRVSDAIEDDIKPTEEEMKKADELLSQLSISWSAIKGTSAEGIRNTFIQREGRLHWQKDHWSLKVKRTAFDVLLTKLPWPLSVVKNKWMTDVIYVEW